MHGAVLPVRVGDILAGKYRIERVLGAGGMGVVLEVTHLELLEPRAVKLMRPDTTGDPESLERFAREARAASLLKSEHVARVHDVGRLPDGAPFMVMEHLDGVDLATALRRSGPMPVDEAALYVLQAAEALAEAHGRGIVHRDVKPANLFLTFRPDGAPCIKVLDFGISKILGPAHDHDLTQTHALLGSPNYMSPEQMQSMRSVDARSDLWSLGVILYQLVTGVLPFRGTVVTEVVAAVLQGSPRPPSQVLHGIPPALDAVVLRCIERDVTRRFADMGALAQALAPFCPGSEALVAAIVRLSGAPARSGAGLPLAVLPDGAPVTPPAARIHTTPFPPADPETIRVHEAGAGATGAWGSTSRGRAQRSSRAIVGLACAGGMVVGALVVWGVGWGRSAPAPASASASGVSLVSQRPPPALAIISAEANVEARLPEASGPAPVVTAAPTASASAAPRPRRAPARDPFGMERK